MKKILPFLLIAFTAVTMFTGCASTPFSDSEEKNLAVVTIMYNKQLYYYGTSIKNNKDDNTVTVSRERYGNNPLSLANLLGENIDPDDMEELKEAEYTLPFIKESNEIIRKCLSEYPEINLIPSEQISSIKEYKDLNNSSKAKFYSFANLITTDEYVLADYSSKIEPVLSEKTDANLFVYLNVDVMKKIKGVFADIRTGTVYPEVKIECTFTDSAGKKKSVTVVDVVYDEGIKMTLGNYDKDQFYELCPKAIENAMEALTAKF